MYSRSRIWSSCGLWLVRLQPRHVLVSWLVAQISCLRPGQGYSPSCGSFGICLGMMLASCIKSPAQPYFASWHNVPLRCVTTQKDGMLETICSYSAFVAFVYIFQLKEYINLTNIYRYDKTRFSFYQFGAVFIVLCNHLEEILVILRKSKSNERDFICSIQL